MGEPGRPYPLGGTLHSETVRRSPVVETATSRQTSGPLTRFNLMLTSVPQPLLRIATAPVTPVPASTAATFSPSLNTSPTPWPGVAVGWAAWSRAVWVGRLWVACLLVSALLAWCASPVAAP